MNYSADNKMKKSIKMKVTKNSKNNRNKLNDQVIMSYSADNRIK